MTLLSLKGNELLAARDSAQFRQEIYDLVALIDGSRASNPDKEDPQGTFFTELTEYPCLARYISGLHITRRRKRPFPLGWDWLSFRPHGGAYTPDWMRDALLENIRAKIDKYFRPSNKLKLQQERLAEFYLLAYFDEALIHKTPYEAPGFGLQQIAAIVRSELIANLHPFDKVFLSVPHEAIPVIQIWP
jgi:hypothetical protein